MQDNSLEGRINQCIANSKSALETGCSSQIYMKGREDAYRHVLQMLNEIELVARQTEGTNDHHG